MYEFNTEQGRTLRAVTKDGYGTMYAKIGSWIGATRGNFKFDYVMIGPGQGFLLKRFGKQLLRKFTGENLRLMKVNSTPGCDMLFADQGGYVITLDISDGSSVKVESECILGFTEQCRYEVGLFTGGTVAQGGVATSILTGTGPGSYVALTSVGNPLRLNTPCRVDPDALICFIGPDPKIETSVSWKTFIGKTTGESYFFNFEYTGGVVIIQPFERTSGINLSMDNNPNANQYNQIGNMSAQIKNTGNVLTSVGHLLGGK